jgi:hypothetical protein
MYQVHEEGVVDQDLKYLRILAAFHLVVAAIIALVSCFPILHLTLGVSMLSDFSNIPPEPDVPRTFDLTFRLMPIMFIVIASSMILGGWLFAGAVAFSGVSLLQRRRHTYSLVVAGVECMFMPIGTVLGVFTVLLLTKPSVRQLYDGSRANPAASSSPS